MSQSVVFNSVTYTIPDVGDDAWGQNLTDYFVAIPSGALQKSGGTFTLTAELNFGATYGIVASYLKSRTANLASAGAIRLAKTDLIEWRNNANTDNLELGVDTSDRLTFNGNPIVPSTPLTASKAVVTDSAGALTTSATSAVQVAYLSSATGTTGTTSTNLVFSTSPTLITPALGTPTALVLTNATGLPLTTGVTGTLPVANGGTGVTTSTGTVNVVLSNSPTLVTPNLGTPSTLVGTNITGTAAGLTAGNVTTNANLTGPITSVGNATSIASQTGTGTTFVMSASPTITGTLVVPNINAGAETALVLKSAGTTALTLSTAQAATFASTIANTGAITQTAASNTGILDTQVYANNASTKRMSLRYDADNVKLIWADRSDVALVTLDETAGGLLLGKGNVSFGTSGKGIVGTTTNDSASAGNVGQYIESVISTPTNFPGATTVWGDGTSISLTAGDWDVSLQLDAIHNGSTTTVIDAGIGTASGSSSAGLVVGSSQVGVTIPSASQTNRGASIAAYRVSISGTTTIYMKLRATYSAGNPQFAGRISARRMR